ATLEAPELAPLPGDIPAAQTAALGLVEALPEQRVDVVGLQDDRDGTALDRVQVTGPLHLAQVHGMLGGEARDGLAHSWAVARADGIRQRGKQVAGQAG